MDVTFDAARSFELVAAHASGPLRSVMPSKIVFDQSRDQNVEARIGDKEKGDFEIRLDSKNFSLFSPPEDLRKSFTTLFNYYFSYNFNQKLPGQKIETMHVVLPLSFSVDFEVLLSGLGSNKYKPFVYRDIEVYAAYYLNESKDLPEITTSSEEDEGAHIYGLVLSGEAICLFLVNLPQDGSPEILDFVFIHDPEELFNILRLNISRYSAQKPRIFCFIEEDVKKQCNFSEEKNPLEELEKKIEEEGKMLRYIDKKNTDNPFEVGLNHLQKQTGRLPVFKLSLFTQDSETSFREITPGSETNITVDFPQHVPEEFFINFFAGTNRSHPVLLKRIFLDTSILAENHVELKCKCDRPENGLDINLFFKDKLYKPVFLPLRDVYQFV